MHIFDTNSLRKLNSFSKAVFPSLWEKVADAIDDETIVSTREVLREIAERDDELHEWCKFHSGMFPPPEASEAKFAGAILIHPKFEAHIPKTILTSKRPFADPYVIARASTVSGIVVTEEKHKPTSAKIPTICEHFGIACMDLDAFMISQGWEF